MSSAIKVLLLYGGKSGEHEVSLMSAASVLKNLDPQKYHIIPVGMDKDGCLFLNDYEELRDLKNALPVRTSRSLPLESLIKNGKLAVDADVVFPIAHGPLYEDGCIQGLLELANVAYVGCGVLASSIGMNKDMQRRLVLGHGIKSTRYRLLSWHASASETEAFCKLVVAEFGWPLFVKPCSMGSSVGIHKATTMQELIHAISDARRYDDEIMVEEFIQGREIELAVLENNSPMARPNVSLPGEICVHHPDGFYSYSAKYLQSEQTDLIVPAMLDDQLMHRLQQMAADIFVLLKCRGMARIDFFVDDKNSAVYLNEVNTLPGFTSISMYPRMWEASGLSYPVLLDHLINSALAHYRCRLQLVTHYQ